MGMFDYIKFRDKVYQTKDTSMQTMETYELRDDGLWYKDVEREWVDKDISEAKAEESWILSLGYFREVSHKWVKLEDYDGLIIFYDYRRNKDGSMYEEEWKVLLMDGKILKLEQIK